MKLVRYDYPEWVSHRELDPWGDVFNRLLRHQTFSSLPSARAFHPNADLWEDDEHYYIRMELPGLKKSDIKVEMENAVLSVSGEWKQTNFEGNTCFSRSVSVPDGIVSSKTKACLEDGILTVTLTKSEEKKPHTIEVH